jgi:hypothetical protein
LDNYDYISCHLCRYWVIFIFGLGHCNITPVYGGDDMKTVGRTEDGERLVAMTDDEYCTLVGLQDVVEGKEFDFDRGFWGTRLDSDMEKVFRDIRQFTLAGFKVNELQAQVDQLREILFPESKK